jgi:uncharacterized protein (DUF1810 family)
MRTWLPADHAAAADRHLDRFVKPQAPVFETALAELRAAGS